MNYRKIDWEKYKNSLLPVAEICTLPTIRTMEEDLKNLSRIMMNTASRCNALTSSPKPHTRKKASWLNKDCAIVLYNRRKALKFFKNHPSLEVFIKFRQLHARAKFVFKNAGRNLSTNLQPKSLLPHHLLLFGIKLER